MWQLNNLSSLGADEVCCQYYMTEWPDSANWQAAAILTTATEVTDMTEEVTQEDGDTTASVLFGAEIVNMVDYTAELQPTEQEEDTDDEAAEDEDEDEAEDNEEASGSDLTSAWATIVAATLILAQ